MSTVDTQHKDYGKMAAKWQRCRDTVSGQDAVHDAGALYLPRLTDQKDSDYNAYKTRAQFYNCVWRTISALSGMMFRKAPVIEASDSVKELLKDVTLGGVSFHIFAQQTSIEILSTGRQGILVDYPDKSVEGMTAADAAKLNLRPTMQRYNAETIINWRTARINNQNVLTLVVLTEDHVEIEEEFKENCETYYRVLDLFEGKYRVRVFRIEKEKKENILISETFPLMNGKPLDFIPFIFIGIDDTTPAVDEPPLIDLVDVNLAHYRLDADHKHGLHFTGLPTAVVSGYTPEEKGSTLYIGSQSAWVFPDAQASATYLEYTGQGLTAIDSEKTKLEQQMAILGARLLSSEKKDSETAQTAQIHRAGESSVLSAIAHTLSIGLTKALNIFSTWAGANEDCSVTLNQEFLPPELTPQELTTLLQGWQMGAPGFSDQNLFEILKSKELISSDVTLEDELERIGSKEPKLIGE
jgi:hypothetical protein